jgi:hypothetical protein
MNEEAIKALYESISADYEVGTIDDFKIYLSDDTKRAKFFDEVIKPEYDVESLEQFETVYGLKKKVVTPSDGVEEVTVSTTETEIPLGSSDGLEVNVEQTEEVVETTAPAIDSLYLEQDLNSLMDIESATESNLTPGASARARMMRERNRNEDPKLKKKILADYNVSAALKMGVIDEALLQSALRGNKKSIEKIQELSVKTPEQYTQEIADKDLNNPAPFEGSSELVEFVASEDDKAKKLNLKSRIKEYDKETSRLLDQNPNATNEELEAIYERPNDPNYYSEDDALSLEDEEAAPRTGFEDSYIHEMYDTNELKEIEKFNVKDFDGYLRDQGYMDKYQQMLEDNTLSEDGRTQDLSGNYNPALAAERLKAQYLTNYVNNKVERSVESQVLNYKLKNKGKHPLLSGAELDYSTGIDDEAMTSYIEEKFPILTFKLKKQDVKNEENYQSYLSGENPWFNQSIKQGWRSVEDRINSTSEGVYGVVSESFADEIRMLNSENELSRDNFMRYSYASGVKASVNGKEYGIDERGQIYDLDVKANVTNVLTANQTEEIRKAISESDKTFKSFSGAGTAVIFSGIASDVVLQVAATRGVSIAGQSLKAGILTQGVAKLPFGNALIGGVKLLDKIPMKATTASAMIAQGTLFSTNLASSTYKSAIENGVDEETAVQLRHLAGLQGFALGSLTAPISTQTVVMNKIFGLKGTEKATEKVTKEMVNSYLKGGEKGVISYLNGLKQKIINNYPTYLKEGQKEVIQENVQQSGQAYIIGENVNEIAGKEIMANTITGAEFTNTTILSVLAGSLMPFAGDMSSATTGSLKANFSPGEAAIDRLQALHELSGDIDKTKSLLNSMVTQGVYTEEQVSDLISDIDTYATTINSIPTNLTPETSLVVMNSLNEIKKQEELKKSRDKSFHPEIDAKIQDLRNEITARTQFDYVNPKGRLKLKEEAASELLEEAENRGEKEFTIEDGAITQRAIDNFNRMNLDSKLEYTDLDKQETVKEDQAEKTERLKDSQIPTSQQKFTVEDDAGDTVIVTVTTNIDGSRNIIQKLEDGTVVGANSKTLSKDNTLTDEEYVNASFGDVKKTEDVDIKTVRNPKLESKMSDRQRKAAGIDTQKDESEQVEGEVLTFYNTELQINTNNLAILQQNLASAIAAKASPEYIKEVRDSIEQTKQNINEANKVNETTVAPTTKPETKKFQDDNVVLKEETFNISWVEDGSRQEVTVRTYLDGSLGTGAKVKRFDSNGELIEDSGSFSVNIGDKDLIARDGSTAEEQVEFGFAGYGFVMEKTSERSGNEINNPKKTAQLTTEQKQKLGIETKKDESEQSNKVNETTVAPTTKPEAKKFQDDNVVLKEETFTITDKDGGKVVTTVRTNLDGSLRKAESETFDADGNSVGKGINITLADNNIVVRDGLTAEQLLTGRLVEGEVIEKTSERSGNEINNPKKTAQLTTEQKQKLGIETKKDESEQTVSEIDEVTVTEDKVVPAGKRLFNKPNPETTEISKKYKKDRNDETPEGEPITSIDKDNSREIADVYESLEDSPNDPKVQEAYLLMADETAEQYKEIEDAGYQVEIWKGKGEPYANAQEMIDDVRENKHMWIYSTEAGFGDTEITEEQRQQNKLLQDSGYKDKNGDTLLYNDLFRFVHDFFGHTERGNGFGPVGEENAWDVHSRMYTPLARRAMTTETRGQNSWVNFGPQMRNDKGELIKKGEEGYIIPKERAFAPQKMALMPEKYSELLPESEVDSGDKKVAPSKTPTPKDKAPSTKKVETSVSKLSKEFKSGKPSMEEVYNKAEDLGIPLKEAREYLEEIGYTEKEIKDFVIKREDMSVKRDVAGEKNIFVKGKNITLNFLDTIKRYAASAKSYMPKNAFIAKETKNAHIQAEIKVAERIAKRLNKMLKGQPDSVYDEVNKLIRGEEADLPKKIALIATAMRNHIDSLSEKLVMSGAVESEGAAANIMSNIGTYMNRSYRLFDDKNYADNISEEVILEAKEFLKAQELNRIIKEAAKENITPQEYVKKQKGSKNFTVEQYVDAKSDQSVRRIINKNEANAFVSAVSNEAKKDTKIFKERKEIPAEIRALMGEYTDAAYNYVMSVGKIKAIIETQKYLNKLKDIGDGVFLFEDGDIRIPDTGYTKIAAETNQSLAPLNGYHAPTELVNQMNSGPLNAKGLGEVWQKAFEVYMKGIGAVKYTKTILSVGTHAKNVLGNAYFMAQNGYFNPKDYNEAFKVLKNEFKNLDNEQLNKKLDEYIKAGIINQGVSLREVQGLLEGEQDFDVTIEKRTAERSENKIKKAAKNLGKSLEELYQSEDDLFKIVAYENEKRDYAKIEFDKKYEELSEKEKAKVDSKVAEIVKNILPNYSRLGNISKILRVAPVATFISFQLEAYRTAYNTLDLSLKEVKSKNPRERKKGAKRLTSLIGFQALKYSVLGMLGNVLLGDDDDDEEEGVVQEAFEGALGLSKPKTSVGDARPYLSFWSQNSDILITKAGNGELSYIDMSASDPYGGLAKVVRAAQRSETIEEGIIYAAEELMSPILSTDILSGTVASLLRNEDVYGKKIWEKTDSPDDRAIKMIDAIYKTLEPGTLTSLRKIAGMNTPGKAYTDYGRYVTKMMDKDNRVAEAIGQLTGFKKNDVDVEMKMNYLLGDLKEDMKPIEIKKYIAKKRIETTGDAREYIKLIKSEHPDKYEIYKEASEIVKGAQKFGLSIEKIYPILRSKFPNGDDADIIFLFDQIIDQIIPKDE